MKLWDTLAEAKSATNARNAQSPHRTRGFWVAIPAEGGGFTVRWVALRRPPPPLALTRSTAATTSLTLTRTGAGRVSTLVIYRSQYNGS